MAVYAAERSEPDFAALSVRELLRARDAYHVHLLNLRHVEATAVGRYLVRDGDDGPERFSERVERVPGERGPRTLENSSIQDWSWPCVLVFVSAWMDSEDIRTHPDDMVPRRLYLPDGLQVPTCVVYAPPVVGVPEDAPTLSFPTELVGGGYACLADVQGRQLAGSIACVVSDGQRLYGLTNRHVAGEQGRELYTLINGTEVQLGRSAGTSVARKPFGEVYPGFAGERVELAIDAGLIDLEDARRWTTQIFGIGRLGELIDIRPESLNLSLIDQRLRAFGAGSGALAGSVVALYYRYATRSGVEYVADAILGPDRSAPAEIAATATRPGDSGTLWVMAPELEPAEDAADDEIGADAPVARVVQSPTPVVRPLAMQWGGHRFEAGGERLLAPYALVSFLSTVCRALDVEPVTDWNDNHDLYWGEVGHYTIGARACDLVAPLDLRAYFVANRSRISFDLDAIRRGEYHTGDATVFFPLTDVPDRVWKQRQQGVGRPHEGPNHFADMDDPDANGETLLQRFAADPNSLTAQNWIAFYQSKHITPSHMGLLPFRVAQLYGVMVDELKAKNPTRALAAAGMMAHYVGDACQPLHVSVMHDGRNEAEAGVHEAYETAMVTAHRADIISGLDATLAAAQPPARITGAREAAVATVQLMQRVTTRLPPAAICDAYDLSHRADDLWQALGQATIACMADGCVTLAGIWSSAWAETGAAIPQPRAAAKTQLRALYGNPGFAPSLYLPELAPTLPW
jgi:hypothetical protein